MPVALGLISMILMLKFFGASENTDAYFGAIAIILSMNMVIMMLVDQFLHFYNEIKSNSEEEAKIFFGATFTMSLFAGFVFLIVNVVLSTHLVGLFFSGFDERRQIMTSEYFSILAITLMFIPISHVIRGLLNAKEHYLMPYAISTISSLTIVLAYFYMYFIQDFNLNYVIYFTLAGSILSFLSYMIYLKKIDYLPIFTIDFHMLIPFIKNSFMIRLSGNIHFVLMSLIVNSFLSRYGSGVVSSYYYAEKAITSAILVSQGPIQNIFIAQVSKDWYEYGKQNIRNLTMKYLLSAGKLFIITVAIIYFILPFFFNLLDSKSINSENITQILSFFILMAIWKLVVLVESPFVIIPQVAKQSKIFFIGNSIFVLLLYVISNMLESSFSINALLYAGIFVQCINLLIYYFYTKRLLNAKNQ